MVTKSVFLYLLVLAGASEIDDLEKLIHKRIKEAESYIPPEDNSIYKANDAAHIINNYGIFDFIIVGGGTSGAILANRLSENPDWKILVIEAGNKEDNFTTIPGLYQYQARSNKNWNYKTTPQSNGCYGFSNNECPLGVGRSLGGSSATFEPFYIRGDSKEFDKWASLGNPDWSYQNVLPYFKKSEKAIDIKKSSYHGYEGVIPTTFPNPRSGLYKLFKDASEDNGLEEVDYNGKQQYGVSQPQLNIENGRRVSTSELFNDVTKKRTNLNLTLNAFVTKLLIDESTSYGVQFNKNGVVFRAFTRNDVILSAGPINTAALLLRSGIGPKDELEKHQIKLFQELNVGVNYSDHLVYPGIFVRTPFETANPTLHDILDEYVNRQRGLMAKPLGAEGVSFYKYPDEDQDVYSGIFFTPQNGYQAKLPIQILTNYTSDVDEKLFNAVNVTTDFGLLIYMYDVQSKGQITLKSADPLDFPKIDPSMFSNSKDIQALENAIEDALALVQSQTFQPFEVYLVGSVEPCARFALYSVDYWYCSMRVLCYPANHITGSTPMGDDTSNSVVDQRLRVHGLKRLRIADPGVIPIPISGHPNALSMMIGEKASDIIKADYMSV